MITQSQAKDIGSSRWGMPEAKEAQSKKYKSEFEKDILKLQEAVFLEQIWGLKYKVGQRMRITIDREKDRMRQCKAVVLGDYKRYVLLETVNSRGRRERATILKADILRRHVGVWGQEKGALRVELY
jgi:hypothetical protein